MNFINDLTKSDVEKGKFPLMEILNDSFYYPSSGFDGGIVKDCNTLGHNYNINSFIYCDYATGEDALKGEQNTFRGYHVFASRGVKQKELIPNGWIPKLPPHINMQKYFTYENLWKPFIRWIVYERDEDKGEEHGPKKFSLLYLGGEGVATYQALYWTNKTHPKAIAIIQPGTGFGANWTDFRDINGPLAWVIYENAYGMPDLIYYGGIGEEYADINWKGYKEIRRKKPYYANYQGMIIIYKNINSKIDT